MAKILITGGSGLVGKAISELLLKKNHQPVWLSREAGEFNGIKKFKWDISNNYINDKVFEGVDGIIHLAGTGIADKRWTADYKQQIIDTRVKSSKLLIDCILKNNYPISAFVGGSAIGYYGATQSPTLVSENTAAGHDFLAEAFIQWEKSYDPLINSPINTSIIRTGIVLSKHGGAYSKMIPPFKLGLGAALASGQQFFPWIHINDIAAIFVHALFNKQVTGAYNAVGTELVTSKEFSQQLAKSFNKPFFLPNVPKFILKMALGEGAIMVTEGLKISNQKIKESGFKFEFETLYAALYNLAN